MIHPNAKIGKNNKIGPNVIIGPHVEIGDDNVISGFVSIGTEAEHRAYWGKEPGRVIIGNNNIIREFVTINAGTFGATQIKNHCVMLRGSHLSHDSILEDFCNISCNVMIGGESLIMEGVNMGLSSVCHQRSVIGSYCMIGMGSVVTKKLDTSPGNVFAGNPARFLKTNIVGLHRARIDDAYLMREINRYAEIKRKRP